MINSGGAGYGKQKVLASRKRLKSYIPELPMLEKNLVSCPTNRLGGYP